MACSLFASYLSFGQFQLSDGENGLQIGAMVTSLYNYQIPILADDSKDKDLFRLKDAIIELEGRYGRNIEYEIKFDMADLASQSFDAEDPGLMKAYLKYKDFSIREIKIFDLSLGFLDVPYSRSSLMPHRYSPFFSRAIVSKGEFFNPRDVGVTVSRSFWRNIAHIDAGVFTGLGNVSLLGKNDDKGSLQYSGRIDFSYPARIRSRDVDLTCLPIPVFTLGVNYSYAEKGMFTASDLLLATVAGKKSLYGLDFSAAYKGLSFQHEIHQTKIIPSLFLTPLMGYNTDYYMAGGWYSQINYYFRKIRSVFAARFEEFDQNDLIQGNSQRVAFSYTYLPAYDWNVAFRFTWNRSIREENVIYADDISWSDRFRIGAQVAF